MNQHIVPHCRWEKTKPYDLRTLNHSNRQADHCTDTNRVSLKKPLSLCILKFKIKNKKNYSKECPLAQTNQAHLWQFHYLITDELPKIILIIITLTSTILTIKPPKRPYKLVNKTRKSQKLP